jgi:hypothetical protein
MKRREFVMSFAAMAVTSVSERIAAQGKVIRPDLAAAALKPTNRSASPLVDGARRGVRVSAAEGEGVAFVSGTEFSTGTIEVDLRGKDVSQQSFLGIAFHGGGSAYDCVYFRPFNFRAADPVSSSHAVQYHSSPDYGWQRLRTEHPGQYEQAVSPVPDPNGWFHARLVAASGKVSVFVNDAKDACLRSACWATTRTGASACGSGTTQAATSPT